MLFLCAAMTHSKELHYEKRKEDEEMKNFKKVIAFLMVAAMTLGMGTVAFADGEEASVSVSAVEEANAGDTVQIKVVAAKDMFLNAFTYVITLDENFVEVDPAVIKSGANINEFDEWTVWQSATLGAQQNYNESGEFGTNYFAIAGAETALSKAQIKSGTVLAVLSVTLKTDVKAGDVIATVSQPNGYRDDKLGETLAAGESVNVTVVEKAQPSSSDPQPSSSSNNDTQSSSNAASTTTAAAGTTTAAAAATTAKDITTAEEALAALTDLSKATAAAAKLNKAAFASDADYAAFTAAVAEANKVLNNANATDAEKAAALKTLKDAMAKADSNALIAAVKAVLNTTATTTKTGNGKNKTGDTAPVAVLMVVAIAAFGTAVVVYRKKVNA